MKQRQVLHIVAPNNFVCHFKQLFFFGEFAFWSTFLQIVVVNHFFLSNFGNCGSSPLFCKLSSWTTFWRLVVVDHLFANYASCSSRQTFFANCSEGLFSPTFCTFSFWITFLRLVVIQKRWSGSRWFNWAGGSR